MNHHGGFPGLLVVVEALSKSKTFVSLFLFLLLS